MMKKSVTAALIAATMAVSVMGMSASAEDTCRSYLTGKEVPVSIGRTRPTALMIENDSEAVQYQSGIGSADVMYEAMVEGGITRLMAIFEDYQNVEKIMPIRSCRPYYVFFANEFKAHYGHFGQVIYAVPVLQQEAFTDDIAGIPFGEDGQDYKLHDGSAAYVREHEGVTGIMTNYDMIQSVIESSGWTTEYPADYTGHYQFAEDGEEVALENGIDATTVVPGFENNNARLEYNAEDGLYYRSEFGSAQVDHLTGDQLAFKNVIIQYCDSEMFDEKYLWTDPVNNGEMGEGWYITNGKAEKIYWQKENWSADEPVMFTVTSALTSYDVRESDFNVTRYYDENGNEIKLNQGKTMVEVVRSQDRELVEIN